MSSPRAAAGAESLRSGAIAREFKMRGGSGSAMAGTGRFGSVPGEA
ncbi:MAG TPA: hypothetical protein PLU95_03210 [Syntrophales bacterium]|nr:hypothetical protein [Syntrophales bacterium]HPN08286.1 hypothetical protein [Syntrophales bacterium]HPX80990.1 hypothetical protein [Syntrophales bacterium]HQB13842.1 hypothetical protein [Syntrophales bacterium]